MGLTHVLPEKIALPAKTEPCIRRSGFSRERPVHPLNIFLPE
jgi:hypothetical protein